MTKHVGADWDALRIEFVNATMTYQELAQTHGLKPATVKKRGERGNWMAERRQLSRDVAETAQASLLDKRVEALEEVNEADLAIAWRMRTLIRQRLDLDATTPLSAAELRTLAGAAELAQKISRVAIGVTAVQHPQVHAGQGEGAIVSPTTDIPLTDAQRAALAEVFKCYIEGCPATIGND